MSHRREQIGSTLEREIQAVLARGLNDPRIRGLVTVTGVEVTSDLKHARVLISVLPEEHEALTLHGLRAASGRLGRRRSQRLRFLFDFATIGRRSSRVRFRRRRRLIPLPQDGGKDSRRR